MLRSTGFFRGIDCPFNREYNGRSDKDGCDRPYCHFRHSRQRRASYGAGDVRNPKELHLKQKDQGYDPFNPEVVRPEDQQNGESASVDMGALELELVNRAIEEVRSEVEREQRKLSRIGDEEYVPTASPAKPGAKRPKTAPDEYDPTVSSVKVGVKRSKTAAEEYDPTVSSVKVGVKRSKTAAEEYDPTVSSVKVGVKRSKMALEEYEPTVSSVKAVVKQSKTAPEEYDPTVSSVKAGVKRSKMAPEEYDPTTSFSKVGAKNPKCVTVASHLAYDPWSYQMTSTADYNPSPCVSKYTLDSDSQDNHASSMEYVPTSVSKTSVKKPASRTHTAHLPSPPPSPKYSTNASSFKSKYVLDNSKPSTDMEYDPLSNYSAKLAGKSKRDEDAKGEGYKKHQLTRTRRLSTDDEYVPTVKRVSQPNADAQKYTLSFSESDEESSGTEYRPTSLSRLQQKKGFGGSLEDAGGAGQRERAGETLSRPKQRSQEQSGNKEDSPHRGQEDQEVTGHKDKTENDKIACKPSYVKSSKTERVHKVEMESVKKSINKEKGAGDKGEGKKINVSKKTSHDGSKKDGKSPGKREDEKNKLKEKSVDKCGKDERRNDGKSKKIDKVKSDSGKREKERERGGVCKKPKMSDKEKESNKNKEHKNGKLDSGRREKDSRKIVQGSSSSSSNKLSSVSSKDKMKKSSSFPEGNVSKVKRRSLSHADLFGDESAEEFGEEEEEDEEDEEDEEKLIRRSAVAFKRGSLNKRKASELTPSSSEDEDVGVEDDRADDNFDSGGVDYSSLQVDLDFDSDPMEECLRIFNESKVVKTEDKGRQAKQLSKDSEEEEDAETTLTTLFPGQKKRVSHFSAKSNTDAPRQPPVRTLNRRVTAQEICYQRMQIAQQQALQLAAAAAASPGPAPGPAPGVHPKPAFPGERKRVAHRPSPSPSSSKTGPAEVKPAACRVLSPARSLPGHLSLKAHTSAGILSKTTTTAAQKRVAHTPTLKSAAMKRPVIPTSFGAKVPTNIRQRYLNAFIDECVKFCPTEDAACQMGLEEEKVVYERSSSKNIYLNVAVNALKKLRSQGGSASAPISKSPAVAVRGNRKFLSHEAVLGGRLAAKTSFTVNRTGKQQEEKLTGVTLYRKLREYLMTEEQLQEHSYPRPHPERPGRALVHNAPEKKITDPFAKVCCRCGAEYKINANGNCVRKEECHHHWGRLRRHKVSGGWETQYNCCSGSVGSAGCQVSKQHVQDGRKESLDGYVKTFDKALPPDGNGGVFALDCEMCYTRQGLELTRVTVINADLKVIYDTFVKPESKVVDYNTRFSGVTEEDLENATITLRDVQAVLLNMFGAESILIGHSLESDLFALKLIHSTVVDTAIVFPHRIGLPYKRALRNLMADHLKRIIQDSVEGHDSSEDACACLELMMWKIKEDAKVKR